MKNNSTTRFSKRVDDYVKYRPGYPAGLVPFLQAHGALMPGMQLADIGSGTGISAELFLKAGDRVTGIEPNREMREKSAELLASYEGFVAQDGTAEHTGIADGSIDGIIAGQAFHWFDREASKAEFGRILKPGGPVVLIWNERKTTSDFEKEYDALIIAHARDYVQVDHRNIQTKDIEDFFAPKPVQLEVFANEQVFDFEGLQGRLLSSSYMPARDEEGYGPMIADLRALFERYQHAGTITIQYDTNVYVGRVS